MIAKDIISKEIPNLRPTDNGNRAIEIMENYMVSHLAIVDQKKFNGIISMDDIYNFDLFDKQFIDFKKPLLQAFVYENQHIYDTITSLSLFNSSILAVLDPDLTFLGIITQKSILDALSKILSIKEDGYHLKISLNHNDFSATQIANIVEKNDAKIMSLYVDNNDTTQIFVYVKIYAPDIEAVLQSFERYEYDFVLLNKKENDYSELYQERFDNFLNYLSI